MRRIIILCGLPLAGCGISEGDLILYRVSVGAQTSSTGCYYPEEMPPPNEADDTSSFFNSTTLGIYRGPDDRLILDGGAGALEGAETDEGFEFVGYQIDTTYLGQDNLEAKLSVVTTNRVTMLVDGSAVEGDFVSEREEKCDFLTATPSPGLCEKVPSCRREAHFVGVRLDAPELARFVDVPNPI